MTCLSLVWWVCTSPLQRLGLCITYTPFTYTPVLTFCLGFHKVLCSILVSKIQFFLFFVVIPMTCFMTIQYMGHLFSFSTFQINLINTLLLPLWVLSLQPLCQCIILLEMAFIHTPHLRTNITKMHSANWLPILLIPKLLLLLHPKARWSCISASLEPSAYSHEIRLPFTAPLTPPQYSFQ